MIDKSSLALHGGQPAVANLISEYSSVGSEEKLAVDRVMRSKSLSGFYGSWGPELWGGDEVKLFESEWSKLFGVNHSITVNSATSGLIAALGAIEISPGDEVIVPPYTMSATVMSPLFYGGIPVFADVEPDTFCINIEVLQQLITPKTRAIIAVNLFGHPAKLHQLRDIARKNNLFLIEDNSQSPLAFEHGELAGTIGDIGIFSLNYHKHIHTGEGGICVTNNDQLAIRIKAIRNHAENVVGQCNHGSIANMIGQNYRMTELSAAIGRSQLLKLDNAVKSRQALAERLTEGVRGMEGITPPIIREDCSHSFYIWCIRVESDKLGISRADFSRALQAEGFPHFVGYVRPLYQLPTFQKRIAIGKHGWPFTLSTRNYDNCLCPIAEKLYSEETLLFEMCGFNPSDSEVNQLVSALQKVYTLRHLINS